MRNTVTPTSLLVFLLSLLPLPLLGEGNVDKLQSANVHLEKPVGKVIELTGFDEATAMNVDQGGYRSIKMNDPVWLGDKILTANEQTVTLEFDEETLIIIGPSTTFVIAEYEPLPKQVTVLDLIDGMIRAVVKKKYGPDEKFQVRSPASVMGVRGTEFIVQVDGNTGETKVHTLTGVVAMALNAGLLVDPKRAVLIKAGTMSEMTKAMLNPAVPVSFNTQKFQNELKRIAPQLGTPVSQFKVRNQAPLPGIRPEMEKAAPVRGVGKGGDKVTGHKARQQLESESSGGSGTGKNPPGLGNSFKNSLSERMRPGRSLGKPGGSEMPAHEIGQGVGKGQDNPHGNPHGLPPGHDPSRDKPGAGSKGNSDH